MFDQDLADHNERKVNNFNSLRKSNIKYESNEVVESNQSNQRRHIGYTSAYPTLRDTDLLPNENSFYTSGDGTQYKKIDSDGCIQTTVDFPKNALHIPGKYHELYRHSVVSSEIPQNLRHRFGTKDTNELLIDQVKVHDTLSSIQNSGIIKKVDRTKENEMDKYRTRNNPKNKNEDYLDLGNYLRHTVSHGYPMVDSRGTTFYDYSPDTNQKFLSDKNNYTSPHRRTKDYLGKWTELCIVDTRQTKDLAKVMLEKQKQAS